MHDRQRDTHIGHKVHCLGKSAFLANRGFLHDGRGYVQAVCQTKLKVDFACTQLDGRLGATYTICLQRSFLYSCNVSEI
jgi:hypothetical protein